MLPRLFRQAGPEDVPELCRIRLEVRKNRLRDPLRVPPGLVLEYLLPQGRGWVWESDGRISGPGIVKPGPPPVWTLFVMPGAEGQGITHGLLERAVACCGQKERARPHSSPGRG